MTTFIQFCIAYHALIVALTVATACLWLEAFCAYRRECRATKTTSSYVKFSLYLSERLFVHVAYIT
jgi:hypothetical protein